MVSSATIATSAAPMAPASAAAVPPPGTGSRLARRARSAWTGRSLSQVGAVGELLARSSGGPHGARSASLAPQIVRARLAKRMKQVGWRIALITTVPPVAAALVPTLRDLGHDPVAIISARRDQPVPVAASRWATGRRRPASTCCWPRDKWSVEPLLRASRPDLVLCWGFPWRIPQAALDVPPLGSVNCHPALLPRHRGPIPLAWAFRDGDGSSA